MAASRTMLMTAHLCNCVQALIDPVCLMTCYPDLLHNFVYRQPKWETLFSRIGVMDILRFVCSRDLLIAEVRHALKALHLCPPLQPASEPSAYQTKLLMTEHYLIFLYSSKEAPRGLVTATGCSSLPITDDAQVMFAGYPVASNDDSGYAEVDLDGAQTSFSFHILTACKFLASALQCWITWLCEGSQIHKYLPIAMKNPDALAAVTSACMVKLT